MQYSDPTVRPKIHALFRDVYAADDFVLIFARGWLVSNGA